MPSHYLLLNYTSIKIPLGALEIANQVPSWSCSRHTYQMGSLAANVKPDPESETRFARWVTGLAISYDKANETINLLDI